MDLVTLQAVRADESKEREEEDSEDEDGEDADGAGGKRKTLQDRQVEAIASGRARRAAPLHQITVHIFPWMTAYLHQMQENYIKR